MDLRQISKLLIKISGMVVIVFAITGIPSYITGYIIQSANAPVNLVTWVLVPLIFPLIIGSVMWFFPGAINNIIIGHNSELSLNNKTLNELERIAVTVLGLALMFFALSDMAFHITYVVASNYLDSAKLTTITISAENWGFILATLVEIVFALYLLIKANGLLLLLRKYRS